MTTLPSDDLHSELSAAFDAAASGTLDVPVEKTIEETPADLDPIQADAEAKQKARDDKGRFAPRTETVSTPAEKEARKPPSSWSKDQWDRWAKLDDETQSYIDKREQDFAKGVSTYKNEYDRAAPLVKAIEPYMQQIQSTGMRPEQFIASLAGADRILRSGSPEQKMQAFAKLANDYGISLDGFQGQGNPQFGQMAQTVSALQNRLQQFESFQQQQEQTRLQSQIQEFAASAPHFETVRHSMGQLLASGMADGLKTAYDKAIRLHDDVWQEHQAQQAKDAEATRQAEIARKRAAGSSPRSASPTGALAAGNANKGLRDMLSDSFDSHSRGRV